MKKFLLPAILTFTLSTFSFGQQMEWLKSNYVQYTMNPTLPKHLIAASGNNVFTAGLDSSTMIFGQGVFGMQTINCYTASGNFKWSFSCGLTAYIEDIVTDSSGNILATGKFMETLHLGINDSLVNSASGLNTNIFMICIDSTGALLWKRNIYNSYPTFSDVNTLSADHTGSFWYSIQNYDSSLIIRLDNNGQDVQTYYINGTRTLSSISFDNQNNMFFTGSAQSGTFSFLNSNVAVPDTYMMFVARITSSGNPSWVKLAHDITFQSPVVTATIDGNAFLGGSLMDSTTWGTISFNHPQWVYGMFLTRVDSLGNFFWGVSVPTTPSITGDFHPGAARFLDADNSGNVYLTGITRGTIDWGNNVITSAGAPQNDKISLLSFDYNGQPMWSLTGGCANVNTAFNVCIGSEGSLYFACSTQDTTTFDSLTTNAGNGYAGVFGKVNLNITTNIQNADLSGGIILYPNPASGNIDITSTNHTPEVLYIYDENGKIVLEKEQIEMGTTRVNIESLISGIYFIRLKSGNDIRTVKFIKTN
jgi:Secretion system C-terminal sorting domain